MRFELGRTRTNCVELGRQKKCDENSMKYEEWSKSIELDQTVTFCDDGIAAEGRIRKVRGRAETAESSYVRVVSSKKEKVRGYPAQLGLE